jgi:hypothetical protein
MGGYGTHRHYGYTPISKRYEEAKRLILEKQILDIEIIEVI